ncbi:phosphoenolpyruvate-protein phosphotransferase [Alcanivorax sp. S71-1-4]|jgi:phosphotransferase system, enzyme I, PtsP|uniref:phosphoenolpyruvate--protein phosphotransferase n=1 Tax=Alcanivorax sp. S71-1-4 TaxID=1177159 RepID=UPI00135B10BC|nr:phosphoenolpyruvate--protein phosphotransferase [Alcanivorax sp. S71-1-4]KAF0811163.1 phosphoenolpyruvate-protein phosphotransferase [Alcanivorax sp. S71-1-4]
MLDTLRRIVQEVNSAADLKSALDLMARRVRDAMGTEVCSIYLLDSSGQRYVLMASEGLKREAIGRVSLGIAEGLIGQVGLREEPINLEDAFVHPKFHYLSETGEDPFHAFLGVPVMHHGRVLGVLVVQQRDARRFDQSEEAFLVTISAQLSAVVAHARATGALDDLDTQELLPKIYDGQPGASGAAIGTAVLLFPPADLSSVPDREPENIDAEVSLLESALMRVRTDVRALAERAKGRLGNEEQALFDVYLRMLDKHALAGEIVAKIREGHWAQGALRIVIEAHIRNFELMDDEYLRERAADVRDLGRRVLAELQSRNRRVQEFPEQSILLGEEITPTMLMEVPQGRIKGIAAVQGSRNSHMAIVARAMGIPTVVGAQGMPLKQLDGKEVIVDGFRGRLVANASVELKQQFEAIIAEELTLQAGLEKLRELPAETEDGYRIQVQVNTGLMTDISRSLERGAEGVGLYRTEIPFMMRDRFPSEEEQRQIYREQLQAFAPYPVTMRTLDVGGDKALPYFPIKEENPFLGWRGIRVTLDHPEIFMVQVRAMLKASQGLDNLRIMLPMVTSVFEAEDAQHLIHRAWLEVCEEGIEVPMPPVGVMIEVPAAVYQARALAQRVDFLSVGTNDLTQYLLAVDRNNRQVADLYNSYHPAVLHALMLVVEAAREEEKPVSVCGEMAGEPGSALLLTAMGFQALSMNASNLLKVKAAIRKVKIGFARKLLNEVLAMDNGEVISSYVDLQLEKAGLGELLHHRRSV